jgi:uncharacterized membrane protein YhfC
MSWYVLLSILALVLPFGVSIFLAKSRHIAGRNLLLFLAIGAAGWLLAKIPKSLVILPVMLAKGLPLQMETPQFEELLRTDLTFLVVAAASAGVFEETCKPLGLLLFKERLSRHTAAAIGWIVGIGAGLLESMNFIGGAAYSILGPDQAAVAEVIHVPVERLAISFFHGALTAIVVSLALQRRYLIAFGIPILIHFGADLIIPYAQVHGMITDPRGIQAVVVTWVALTCLVSYRMTRMPQDQGAQ